MKLATISLVLLVVATSVVAVFVGLSLRDTDPTAFNILGAAFCGAAFSFIFVRVGQILDRMDRLQSRHYNALVKAQHYLNQLLVRISDNIYLAKGFIQTVAVERDGTNVTIRASANQFPPFPLESNLALEFSDIDLVNDFAELQIDLERLNQSLEALGGHYAQATATVPGSKPDYDTVRGNIDRVKENTVALMGFLEEAESRAFQLLTTVRVHAKSKPIALRLFGAIDRSTKRSKKFEAALVEEERLLKQEIEASEARSQETIERVAAGRVNLK
ncbi:MAG: hypothetical protein SX243_05350 [Acidobacteriota bacterium]|nr:hypothetical protein [Acidobacteriota bacterium]